jgi:4-diphosphocytidyl-2-C-methyl-D-erythritol kinase
VRLDKRVPPGAGLGGGSADAAAALVGLNTAWATRVPRPRLVELAQELGADVPFFLAGGTALGVGRGDEVYPAADVAPLHLVIIKPAVSVATAEAYRWFDEDAGRPAEPGPTQFVNVGWPTGPLRIVNDLQPAVSRRHPVIGEALAACRREGAVAAAMTGSGSAVFAVFAEGVAQRAARRLRRPDWLVLATRTLSRREAGKGIGV